MFPYRMLSSVLLCLLLVYPYLLLTYCFHPMLSSHHWYMLWFHLCMFLMHPAVLWLILRIILSIHHLILRSNLLEYLHSYFLSEMLLQRMPAGFLLFLNMPERSDRHLFVMFHCFHLVYLIRLTSGCLHRSVFWFHLWCHLSYLQFLSSNL